MADGEDDNYSRSRRRGQPQNGAVGGMSMSDFNPRLNKILFGKAAPTRQQKEEFLQRTASEAESSLLRQRGVPESQITAFQEKRSEAARFPGLARLEAAQPQAATAPSDTVEKLRTDVAKSFQSPTVGIMTEKGGELAVQRAKALGMEEKDYKALFSGEQEKARSQFQKDLEKSASLIPSGKSSYKITETGVENPAAVARGVQLGFSKDSVADMAGAATSPYGENVSFMQKQLQAARASKELSGIGLEQSKDGMPKNVMEQRSEIGKLADMERAAGKDYRLKKLLERYQAGIEPRIS